MPHAALKPKLITLALTIFAGWLIVWLTAFIPGLSPLLIAIFIGAIVGNLGLLPRSVQPSVNWAAKKVLRVGIVFLGFKLSLLSLGEIGFTGIVVLVLTVAITFIGTVLVGRWIGASRVTRLLVATGFSICGASAVAAMSSVVDPEGKHEEETAQAIALVTLYGFVLILVMPPVALSLGLSDIEAGIWLGASIHEVGQVVAAGGIMSSSVLALATVSKLGRVVLLAPLMSIFGVIEARKPRALTTTAKRPPILPLFVVGFLLAVLARTFIPLGDSVFNLLDFAATVLLTSAMFGLGLGVNIRKLVGTGWRPLILGGASTLIAVTASLALILLLGV